MNARNFHAGLIALLAGLFVCSHGYSQLNKNKLLFRRGTQKTSQESLDLTQDDGPWLIMCASFVGEDARGQAERLCLELREKKVNARIFSHEFDYSGTVEGLGWEKYGPEGQEKRRRQRMKPAAAERFEEIAVLVGDFESVEDPNAQKMLQNIKHFRPQSLANFDPDRGTSQRLRGYREHAAQVSSNPDAKVKGPLRNAFLLPNPMLPEEFFAASKVDHFVINLNKKPRFSLLKNPSTYSVRVATFRGEATFEINEIEKQQKELNLLKRSGKAVKKSKLADAFEKAHKLTEELRRQGVDAYEFHDRHESYVCVGGYDWLKRTVNGREENNPEIAAVILKFKGSVKNLPEMRGALSPKVLAKFRKTDIVFDVQPLPVRVPKVSASAKKSWR